ncbi:MAG: metallophosphoesterase [Candidatus Babeliales bacterium]|jgi:hypothetical protein
MIVKKYLLIVLTLILSCTSLVCVENSLVDFSTRFLKGLPEFIGYDIRRGMTNEMKVFYASHHEWSKSPFTLKSNELGAAFDTFIRGCRDDANFNNASTWVNKVRPPVSLFNTFRTQPEIAYPYIQKVVVPEDSTILFMGDTHASPHSLLRALWRWRLLGYMGNDFKLKEKCFFVILGDYVDYGNGGAEMWYLLAILKRHNWNQVFMLRGNHELWSLDDLLSEATFFNELAYKFGVAAAAGLINKLMCAYNLLPSALLIGTNGNYILCQHGGADATYSAVNLLQEGNFYDYLSAVHNFAYDGTAHGGLTNNRFIGRYYSDDPYTMPIETDIAALSTNYSSGNNRTRVIVRGHQHVNIPECFCFIRKGYPVGTDPNTTILPGWQAEDNVSLADQNDITKGSFSLANPDCYPIYTLFSAPANFTRYDCFARIKTAAEFSQWRFKLYQRDLDIDQKYYRNFARFELYNTGDIRTVYSEYHQPFNRPLSNELLELAVA